MRGRSWRSARPAAGAKIRTGIRVIKVQTDNKASINLLMHKRENIVEARAPIVIMAAGARSTTLIPSARTHFSPLAFRAEIPLRMVLPGKLYFLLGGSDVEGAPVGYGWVFPTIDGRSANIGYGAFDYGGRSASTASEVRNAFSRLLRRSIEQFGDNRARASQPKGAGWTIPVNLTPPAVSCARILLVGDAAGLANPATGEGIGPALISGTAAGHAAIGYHNHGSLHQMQDEFWSAVWGGTQLMSSIKRRVAASLWRWDLLRLTGSIVGDTKSKWPEHF